jgi:phenylacetate-CoA ligase
MPIWNPEIECANREVIEKLQLHRLKKQLAHAYENSSYYRAAWQKIGIGPGDINELVDIRKLPFTDKTALRDTFPFGMFAVPIDEVARIHASSGTTGKPIVAGYTKQDLDAWSECIARLASAAGVVRQDRALMAFPYSMFTGGWGLHYGMEKIGAMMIPAGAAGTERHLQIIEDYGATVLISTPSYAMHLAEAGLKTGYDWEHSTLRIGLFGGEPCTLALKYEIERIMHITCTDNYGLTEIMGPGISGECLGSRDMSHIAEDHVLWEVVDPDTGDPVPNGQEGELILTTLTKEAMPVFRYRTHDLTYVITDRCVCGRTSARMKKVRKRTDDMLIIRGVNVFPSQFEDILADIDGASVHYRLIVTTESNMDAIELVLELEPSAFSDSMVEMEHFHNKVVETVRNVIGIRVKVTLVEPGHIERAIAKTHHVIDKRSSL